jgi:hypothetical protein
MIQVTSVNIIQPIVGSPCRRSCAGVVPCPDGGNRTTRKAAARGGAAAGKSSTTSTSSTAATTGVGDSNAADKQGQRTDDAAGNQNLLQLFGCACFHF